MRQTDSQQPNDVDASASTARYLDGLGLTEPQKQAIRNVYAREEAGQLRSDLWETAEAEDAEYSFLAGLWRADTGDQVSTDQDSAIAWLGQYYGVFCTR